MLGPAALKQFKKADKSGALYALILGENELAEKLWRKLWRTDAEQVTVAWDLVSICRAVSPRTIIESIGVSA